MLLCSSERLACAPYVIDDEHFAVVVVAVLDVKRDSRIDEDLHHAPQGTGSIRIQLGYHHGAHERRTESCLDERENGGVSIGDEVVGCARPHPATLEADTSAAERTSDQYKRFGSVRSWDLDVEHHTVSIEGSTMTSAPRLLAT
ncbi:hypothetical protein GCM10009807_15280 [Microbacterium lacus]|uniref:Uncharacterized protein n=1 Tax=Microbacterium lacus TaxID=415217 RepID=A0ABN2GJ36_9MICO